MPSYTQQQPQCEGCTHRMRLRHAHVTVTQTHWSRAAMRRNGQGKGQCGGHGRPAPSVAAGCGQGAAHELACCCEEDTQDWCACLAFATSGWRFHNVSASQASRVSDGLACVKLWCHAVITDAQAAKRPRSIATLRTRHDGGRRRSRPLQGWGSDVCRRRRPEAGTWHNPYCRTTLLHTAPQSIHSCCTMVLGRFLTSLRPRIVPPASHLARQWPWTNNRAPTAVPLLC